MFTLLGLLVRAILAVAHVHAPVRVRTIATIMFPHPPFVQSVSDPTPTTDIGFALNPKP